VPIVMLLQIVPAETEISLFDSPALLAFLVEALYDNRVVIPGLFLESHFQGASIAFLPFVRFLHNYVMLYSIVQFISSQIDCHFILK
jgi:hypothetical protein